jgi:hypothetical protein
MTRELTARPDRRESGDQEQEDGRKQDDTESVIKIKNQEKRLSGKHKRNGIDKDELELVKPKRD